MKPSSASSSRSIAEAERRFGTDAMQWKFVCPSCGVVTTVGSWKAAGAGEGEVAFSCIGRRIGGSDECTFKNQGGPCTYAGGGLFAINPVHVLMPSGAVRQTFAFA